MLVGVNCHFDPFVSLEALKLMKVALEEADLLSRPTYLMCQPLGYSTPDAGKQGFIDLPEFPFALEPRILTRWEMHRYAREAWELGVRWAVFRHCRAARAGHDETKPNETKSD